MTSPLAHWRDILREPFVVLDFEGEAALYRSGDQIVAHGAAELAPALDRLRGTSAAGFLTYEAGHALEPKLAAHATRSGTPLLWFMVGGTCEPMPPFPDPAGAWASQPVPRISREDYVAKVETIRDHILDGDIYQANFTFQSDVRTLGHPLAIYAQLRKRAQGRWNGLVFTGEHWLLSFSPELFFTCAAQGRVTCRPMKGTAAPGSDPEALRNDPKQRAENLMIVDLLRNDLSRVSQPDSVHVPEMFAVETYPTVMQMTSTVTGQLRASADAVDVLKAMFPCGSITGAPKIRAMEIIRELEQSPRGLYTGSIGRISENGSAAFNVAIRTLVMREGEDGASIGLGSGIVADSEPIEEWEECRRKGAFVATPPSFRLIETMLVDAAGAIPQLDAHLSRLERSAGAFNFAFDRLHVHREVKTHARGPGRLRLELASDGSIEIAVAPMPDSPAVAEVVVVPRSTDRHDFRLRHKTTDRAFYDEPRIASGAFEVLLMDDDGFLTEGSFTNLFVRHKGCLLTPPAHRGLLPGILRQHLLASGEVVESDLRIEHLAGGFFVGNALRGLIPARLRTTAPRH